MSPFQNIDAQTASRAYYGHLNEKPQDGEPLLHALVDGFSTVPSSDGAWDPVKNISQGMDHTTNLQLADQFWSNQFYGDNTQDGRPSTLLNTPRGQIKDTGMETLWSNPSIDSYGIAMEQRLKTRFWLRDVRQEIENFRCDHISISKLRNTLATNTPRDHIQTVYDALVALDSGCVNQEVLDGWLEKLQVEVGLQQMLGS